MNAIKETKLFQPRIPIAWMAPVRRFQLLQPSGAIRQRRRGVLLAEIEADNRRGVGVS